MGRFFRFCVPLAAARWGLAASPARPLLVVCSPGSPGSTTEAQPTMDSFAAAAPSAAGWHSGGLGAIYYESAEPGRERLAQSDAALALVSAPFFFEYEAKLSLRPLLEAIPEAGAGEVYSLVAKKGLVPSVAALAGWEITGGPGFSADFVRQAMLAGWGPLPVDVRITFSGRPLTDLHRAASGEKVAVVLDREQAASLGSLPFGADLEVIHRSQTFPSGLLCLLPSRLPKAKADSLVRALRRMNGTERGREVLKSMRLSRFAPVAASGLKLLAKSPASSPGSKP